MSVFVTNITSMLGIGVAVDYSLFVLTRYREELHAGKDRDAALDVAMRTSGATVVFSGVTVHHLAGRAVPDRLDRDPLAGDRRDHRRRDLDRRRGHAAAGADRAARPARRRARQDRRLRRRPVPPGPAQARAAAGRADVLGALDGGGHAPPVAVGRGSPAPILLALAIPALSLAFGNGALRQFPPGNETREGFELASEQVPPGEAAPLLIVVDADGPIAGGQAAARRVRPTARDRRRRHPRRGPDRLRRRRGGADQGRRRRGPRGRLDARAARAACAPRAAGRPARRASATSTSAATRPSRATSSTWSRATSGRSSCS